MIICRTPYRVSFFGGGTDYPQWYREHGGSVLSVTVNRYCYITARYLPPFFEHRSRVVWGRVEVVDDNDKIEHPVVRSVLQMLGIKEGVEIHYDGDLPARTGIGSSSSFTVGMLHTLLALQGRIASKEELAQLAIHIEQERLQEVVGVQDQIAVAHGGFNRINIHADDRYEVIPMTIPAERIKELNDNLILFYTGISRTASVVAADKVKSIPKKHQELFRMKEMVDQAVHILNDGRPIDEFGDLLNEAWLIKRGLSSKVSTSFIDDVYNAGLAAGARGGKLLGAGGGGFVLFYAPMERHEAVQRALHNLLRVPIEFEYSGSQVVFFSRDPYTKPMLTSHYSRVLA